MPDGRARSLADNPLSSIILRTSFVIAGSQFPPAGLRFAQCGRNAIKSA